MEQQFFDIKVQNYGGYRCHYIKDESSSRSILKELGQRTDRLLGIDAETAPNPGYETYPKAALSPHLSSIRLLQICDGKNSVVFDLRHLDAQLFIPFLEKNRFIGHNSIFDLQYFIKLGVKNMNIGCTLLLAKLIMHATRPVDISLSLEALTENVLGIKALKKVQNSDWGNEVLTREQIEYAALDPIYTLLLAEKLAPGLTKYGLERVYRLYKDVQHPVAHMQLNGLLLDSKAHKENIAKWREEHHEAKMDVLKFTGLQKLTGHTLAKWLEENLPKEDLNQWPKTEKGKLKTDSHAFADFSHLPIAEKYEKYQKLDKLLSSFGDKLLSHINPATGRIHASYRISGARTGRMSCSDPNLQQLPRDEAVRNIFVALEDYVIICADFSMIELRVLAEISKDTAMLKAFKDGIDLHTLTASKLLRIPLSKVEKSHRQHAKAFNFGLIFGLGPKSFVHYSKKMYGLETTFEKAQEDIDVWKTLYSGVKAWQLSQSNLCGEKLWAKTVCGKRVRLTSDNYYGTGLNVPVQGSAAEVMLHSLIILQSQLRGKLSEIKIINCVHDEISITCPKYMEKGAKVLLESSMEAGFLSVFPRGCVNKLVEAKIGTSWGEAK